MLLRTLALSAVRSAQLTKNPFPSLTPFGGVLNGPSVPLAMDGQEMCVRRIAGASSGESEIPFTSLLLEHAGVSGNAQPFAIRIDPGVGEPPIMFEGLTFV